MQRATIPIVPGRTSRVTCGVLLLAAAGWIGPGCHAPESSRTRIAQAGGATLADGSLEKSVKPGVNEKYENPDVDVWVGRFESESREIARYRREIVDAIGVEPGMVVADIGAGTGLFTPLFAEAVGPEGKVLAVDIVPKFLELIRERAGQQGLRNVQTILSEERSVTLEPGSVDLAFVCDTYHHFEYPKTMLRSIHRALKPGGLFVVIDFDRVEGKSRAWVLGHVRASQEVFTSEIVAAGFVKLNEPSWTPYLEENFGLRFRKVD